MNRSFLICRLRWPLFLLLTGVIALLNQAHILSWGHAWPLYLILWGVLALAERASLAQEDVPPYPPTGFPESYPGPYQGGPYAGAPYQTGPAPAPAPPVVQTSIVPVHGDEITHRGTNGGSNEGGQS